MTLHYITVFMLELVENFRGFRGSGHGCENFIRAHNSSMRGWKLDHKNFIRENLPVLHTKRFALGNA